VESAAALLSPAVASALAGSSARGDGTTLRVRPIAAAERFGWRAHMERFHYLGDAALVGESLRYVAELDGEMVALLSWGAAALRNGPREQHVGWDAESRAANLHRVVNNARFLILPWGRRPNLASRVLAANLRRLSNDWEQVYGHPVVLAETFVDVSRFEGTCYRASNWICVGETKGWAKSGAAYRFHGQPKAVWLYPLARDFKEQLCAASSRCTRPSSRSTELITIDVERLPLHGEGGLFEILKSFHDPRKRRGIRHAIESILAIKGRTNAARSWLERAASPPSGSGRPTSLRRGSDYWGPSAARPRTSGPTGVSWRPSTWTSSTVAPGGGCSSS